MVTITVRGLPAETYQALKDHAKENGRSMAAEIRAILEDAVRPTEQVKIGSALAAFGRRHNIVEFNIERDQTPAEPAKFD